MGLGWGLMKPAVAISAYSYQYPGRTEWAISDISLSIQKGECICFTGPSGCGKSTLFLALKGLLRDGQENGSIRLLTTGNGSGSTGLVFQNAESHLICTTVADEAAFGPRNRGFTPQQRTETVRKSLEAVSLSGLERRNVETLSAGQAERLGIASVLSTSPAILLLDEPTAQLDAEGKAALAVLLARLKAAGHTLLIADHELGPFESLADRFVLMDQGRIQKIHRTLPTGFTLGPSTLFHKVPGSVDGLAQPLLEIERLLLLNEQKERVFNDLALRFFPGQQILIYGRNGAGKSTLLKCMAGLIRPQAGHIEMDGVGRPRPDRVLGKMGLLFQNPERQLFEDTVWDEVGFSLKRMGLSTDEIQARVTDALDTFEVAHLKGQSPLTLSFGEQHRVALASIVAPQPDILMLDEPFSGLDFFRRKRILRNLSRLRRQWKTTVVIASHEFLPDNEWAHRTLLLKEGRIEEIFAH